MLAGLVIALLVPIANIRQVVELAVVVVAQLLAVLLADYFPNMHKFATPISDYHEWYLYWWMAWSIMIGQFVARFVGGLKTWHLFLALLILPSISLALWFSVHRKPILSLEP